MPRSTAAPVVMVLTPMDSKQVSLSTNKETSQTVTSTLTTKASIVLPIQPVLLNKSEGKITQSDAQPAVSKLIPLTRENNGVSITPVVTVAAVSNGVPFTSNMFVKSSSVSRSSSTALVRGKPLVNVPETVKHGTVKTNTVSSTATKASNSLLPTSNNSHVQSSVITTTSGVSLLRGQELIKSPGTKNRGSVTTDTASNTPVLSAVTNSNVVEPRSNFSCVQASMATATSVVALVRGQNLVPRNEHLGNVTMPLQTDKIPQTQSQTINASVYPRNVASIAPGSEGRTVSSGDLVKDSLQPLQASNKLSSHQIRTHFSNTSTQSSVLHKVVAQPCLNREAFTPTIKETQENAILTSQQQLNLPLQLDFLDRLPNPTVIPNTTNVNTTAPETKNNMTKEQQLVDTTICYAASSSISSTTLSEPYVSSSIFSSSTSTSRFEPNCNSVASSASDDQSRVLNNHSQSQLTLQPVNTLLQNNITTFPSSVNSSNDIILNSSKNIQTQISDFSILRSDGPSDISMDFASNLASSGVPVVQSTADTSNAQSVAITCATTFSPLSPIMSANTLNSLLNFHLPSSNPSEFSADVNCGLQLIPQTITESCLKELPEADVRASNSISNQNEIVVTTNMFSSRPKAAGSGYGLGNDFEELFAQMFANQGNLL